MAVAQTGRHGPLDSGLWKTRAAEQRVTWADLGLGRFCPVPGRRPAAWHPVALVREPDQPFQEGQMDGKLRPHECPERGWERQATLSSSPACGIPWKGPA